MQLDGWCCPTGQAFCEASVGRLGSTLDCGQARACVLETVQFGTPVVALVHHQVLGRVALVDRRSVQGPTLTKTIKLDGKLSCSAIRTWLFDQSIGQVALVSDEEGVPCDVVKLTAQCPSINSFSTHVAMHLAHGSESGKGEQIHSGG